MPTKKLDNFYYAVMSTDVEVPYPLVRQAARWWAQHRTPSDVAGIFPTMAAKLTIDDLSDLVETMPRESTRPAPWAVHALLVRPDLDAHRAAQLVAAEPRKSVRADVARLAANPHVLEILSRDEHFSVLVAVAGNAAAAATQRFRAIMSLTQSPKCDLATCRNVVNGLPADVADQLVEHSASPLLRAALCAPNASEGSALTLVRTYVAPALETSSGADVDRALDAACHLARHPSPLVRRALLEAGLRYASRGIGPLPVNLSASRLEEPASGTVARVTKMLLLDAGDRTNDAATAAGLNALSDLGSLTPDGWAAFERIAETFTGTLTELAAVCRDITLQPPDQSSADSPAEAPAKAPGPNATSSAADIVPVA